MKNIYYFIVTLVLGFSQTTFAQWEGQKFIYGSASLDFINSNPDLQKSTNSYGYNFDLGIGKFKTSTRAVGWTLSTSLSGGKQNLTSYINGIPVNRDKNGIIGMGVGVGRFWQFYKHFNDKMGIFAGPDVNMLYNNAKTYSTTTDSRLLITNKSNVVSISGGLKAGVYYKLSPKWWVTGSIAFSNFASVSYTSLKSEIEDDVYTSNQKTLNYQFSPSFRFPNVGFGLRYFIK